MKACFEDPDGKKNLSQHVMKTILVCKYQMLNIGNYSEFSI